MPELEKKLRDIAKAMVFDGSANGKDTPIDPWVAHILQAFEDDGWIRFDSNAVPKLVDGPCMYGSEWLSRFKAELDKEMKLNGGSVDMMQNTPVMEAARRAAGVTK